MAVGRRPSRSHKNSGAFRALPTSRIPKVIPPRTVVILTKVNAEQTPDWAQDRGRLFRIGYYNRSDGLDCIWLVNEDGEYEQTTDRDTLLDHFIILQLAEDNDYYGEARKPLKPLKLRKQRAFSVHEMLAS